MSVRSAVIVMGVSGCGKSTIGRHLGDLTGDPFFDGDDYHPKANIAKMSAGTPLTDADRAGWLQSLCDLIQEQNTQGFSPIIACSALKRKYRDQLRGAAERVSFLHAAGSRELIAERMRVRSEETGHFMNVAMLDSQFATLEDPALEPDTCTLDIAQSPQQMCELAVHFLNQ